MLVNRVIIRSAKSTVTRCVLALILAVVAMPLAFAKDTTSGPLDRGFRDLYDLNFDRAQQEFGDWQRENPEDPIGPVSEAAGLLFSEFHRLGVLEAQFYENDSAFAGRKKLTPNASVKDRFNSALVRTEAAARARLVKDPRDRNALFAMTLASGLKADYAALIEKRNLASLHFAKDASAWADKLLAIDPNYYDAHLATGFSKYIIGTMSAPVRWILRVSGVSGDKQAGMQELQLTANHGHYLAPFARILLAIAYVREKDTSHALQLLASLHQEFPNNPLFPKEMARLEASR